MVVVRRGGRMALVLRGGRMALVLQAVFQEVLWGGVQECSEAVGLR
jgi:hypothetical protein